MVARAPLRTYSKRKHQDGPDKTLKRRRVLDLGDDEESQFSQSSDVPSSDAAVFSDENVPSSTPPSSPPSLAVSPTRTSLSTPTSKTEERERKLLKHTCRRQKSLVQMQLNFGQAFRRTCKECGMEYVPSVPEDTALHKKFHVQHSSGVVMEKDFLKKAEHSRALWRGTPGVFIMCLKGYQDPKAWLNKARVVFDIATADLGAVAISDEQLWGPSIARPNVKCGPNPKAGDDSRVGKYNLYLYLGDGKCLGLCLAEHIDKGYKVVEPKEEKDKDDGPDASKTPQVSGNSAPLIISEEADEASIGISRIWTSRTARNKGIATALLDCVEATFGSGKGTPRHMVAFSQPTEMGTRLARRWFGKQSGWHVYMD